MRQTTLLFLLICGSVTSAFAQSVQLSSWNTLSSLVTTRDADVDASSVIWAATTGGVYAYRTDGSITEYRNINALQTLSTTSILCEHDRQEVFVGGETGSLDIHQADDTWHNITDIVRATQYPKRGIRDMVAHNGIMYIATDFGVVTFDIDDRLFIETIDRIGTLQEKTRANSIAVVNDSLWVATDSGLAVAPLNVSTLRLPSVWRIYGTNDGLPSASVQHLTAFNQTLAASSGSAVTLWNGTGFTTSFTLAKPVRALTSTGASIIASTEDGLFSGVEKLPIPWSNILLGHTSATVNNQTNYVGYILDKGIEVWDGSKITAITINSPISNQFARLAIDTKGALWVATDVDPPRTGQGLSVSDNGRWRNINAQTSTQLKSNACYRVSAISDGSVMIGTWGAGAYQATWNGDDIELQHFTTTNSAFKGITADSNFVLASDAARDRNGNIWVINEQAATNLFVRITPDDATSGFSNCVDSRNNLFRTIAVDGAGNKWAGSTSGTGLVAYNDRGTSDRADDICNAVRTSNSQLPDNVISALRIDKTGGLWIGTAKGVAVMSGPTSVSNTTIPFVRRITSLTSVVVNDIYVDALNYKWIATTSGVYVLNEDGTSVLSVITKDNSPLLDDNIRSVVVDDRTGIAYFGTSSGCSSAQTSSIQPTESFDLSFRPQPFRVDADDEVIIDGLAADADVKIMTAGGIMVTAFQARGRQAAWNGRDTQGNKVPPGVYIVQTSSAASSTSAVGKLVVKR
ncbi:MAG: hypothetical protein EHM43_07055 [Ignavibacteriae bacterium]|nr:MAG: hypothetical protein EHM43_07055 [Ignavibacteriota bacterium]